MSEQRKPLPVKMPADLKEKLETMSSDVGITQNNLTVLALHSLISNYSSNGTDIFLDLIVPKNNQGELDRP